MKRGVQLTAILAGAMQAGITTLASQATISTFNNAGNLGKVFDELTSSESLQNLATAMVTAGALQGLSTSGLLPDNLASATNGTAKWTDQLQRQLIDNTAAAVIRSGINGTSLQDELQQGILTAFLNTGAAQGANWIGQNGPQGNQSLNAFAAEAAHAIVGCAVGAGRSGSGSGCAPGALGAVIGHLTAQAVNPTGDPALANETLQASQLMAGVAGALVSANGQGVYTAASAGVNAAENNYLSHDQQSKFREALKSCNGEAACIQRETAKWEGVDRQQSAAAANCKTVSECTEISRTARTGIGFTLADAQAMCGGVQGCVDFATDLGRRDVYDEVNARGVGYANALAARRAQLLAAGLDPDSATIGAGITPGDAASAVGGIAAATIGGIRSTTALAALSLAPPPNTYSVSPRGAGSAEGPLPSGYTTVSRWVSPEEAALWVQNQGTAIPAAVPRNGTPQLYVTEAGAPYPPGANGTVRIDFAVPQGMLRPGNSSNNFMILQPSTSTPIYNVNIHVPNGQVLPSL